MDYQAPRYKMMRSKLTAAEIFFNPVITLLIGSCPEWVKEYKIDPGKIDIEVFNRSFSGLHLAIKPDEIPRVSESVVGTRFPSFCPQRHIERDGNFCLGLNGSKLIDQSGAKQWWEKLNSFLRLQNYADKTGMWHKSHELDHGDAGQHHAKAIEIAKSLGIEDEYTRHHAGNQSWIQESLDKSIDDKGRLITSGLPCPVGCKTVHGRSAPLKKCEHRNKVIKLLKEEQQRLRKLDVYWAAIKSGSPKCCETIRTCPLREV